MKYQFRNISGIFKQVCLVAVIFSGMLLGCASDNPAEMIIEAEKEAILQTIATETEAYFNEDYELWKNQFVDEDYFMRIGYWEGYPNKVSYHEGFEALRTEKKLQFEQGATQWSGSEQTRENLNFQIYDEVAWVTYDQLSLDPETGELTRLFNPRPNIVAVTGTPTATTARAVTA
jgi:hypothetical protein